MYLWMNYTIRTWREGLFDFSDLTQKATLAKNSLLWVYFGRFSRQVNVATYGSHVPQVNTNYYYVFMNDS